MAKIPNTEVTLYNNVPLDSGYENTLYADTVDEQTDYFDDNYTHQKWVGQSYIRPTHTGVIQVNASITEGKSGANYVIFINKSHENKYWFAFVNEVIYVNEETI